MQAFLLSVTVPRRSATPVAPATRHPFTSGTARAFPRTFTRAFTHLRCFIAADRDRWVPLVCGTGFACLMWLDWLAA